MKKKESNYNVSSVKEEYVGKSENGLITINNSHTKINVTSKLNPEAAEKITEYLVAVDTNEWQSVKEETDDQVNAVNSSIVELNDVIDDYGVELQTTKTYENDKYISFEFVRDGSMGGVSWYASKLFNFDKETGELLDPVHLVEDVNAFKEEMYNYCLNYLKADQSTEGALWNDEISGNWEEILKNQLFANGNWSLTENRDKIFI